MKKSSIFIKYSIFGILCFTYVLMNIVSARSSEDMKLVPGARGKTCLECHEKYQNILKNRYVHPLMKKGECTGCHNPHTSSYNNLLSDAPDKLCLRCHDKLLQDEAKSIHPGVSNGECKSCHDPHGSENNAILIKEGSEICLGCHDDIRNIMTQDEFVHNPMVKGKGCLNCHDPHSSTRSEALLKNNSPAICLGCHKTDKSSFKKMHMDFNVAKTDCVSCHNPHGSDKKGILYADAHAPVSERDCGSCHVTPSDPKKLKTGTRSTDVCNLCHKDMIDQIFDKKRIHWSLISEKGCMNCHNPHASKHKKLLSEDVADVCGECHSDTISLQESSKENPENKLLCEPVKSGNCVACHSPHSADAILLMKKEDVSIGICGDCHEWQTHTSHPFGEEIVDQRNRNLTLDCLSCHKACGTGNFPNMLHYPNTYELCVQCHVDRKR